MICVWCLHDLYTVEKLLGNGGEIVISGVWGVGAEHWCQCCFSMLEYRGRSFISILSVSSIFFGGFWKYGVRVCGRGGEEVCCCCA